MSAGFFLFISGSMPLQPVDHETDVQRSLHRGAMKIASIVDKAVQTHIQPTGVWQASIALVRLSAGAAADAAAGETGEPAAKRRVTPTTGTDVEMLVAARG